MKRSGSLAVIAALIVFALAAPASADDLDLQKTLVRIDAAQSAGRIDADQALVAKVATFFAPDTVPAALRVAGAGDRAPICGTPVILEAASQWDRLSDTARAQISAMVAVPDYAAMRDAYVPASTGNAASVSDSPHSIDTPNAYRTEHFNIRWGETGDVTQSNVERLGQHLEESWDVEVGEYDYPAPSYTDEYLMDIYVGNTGGGAPSISFQGAYTTVYQNSPYMAYIVIHPDILTYAGASEEISAHEFFHTLQFGIALSHGFYCYTISTDDQWLWEATAVWAEDIVYPDNNSYVSFLNVYVDEPEEALHSQVDFYYQYSRVLFFKYMSEYQGGPESVHEIWTACDPSGTLTAIDDYLSEQDTSLRAAFVDFMNRNARMDYDDGDLYDDVTIVNSHSSYPVTVTDIDDGDRPRYLGANFIEFEPDGSMNETLVLQFNGNDSANSSTVTWGLGLVMVKPDGDYESGRVSLEDGNQAKVTIEGFGSDYRKVYMIPSVIKWGSAAGTYKGVNYQYAADLTTSGDDDDSGDDDSGDDDDDDSSGGCGA